MTTDETNIIQQEIIAVAAGIAVADSMQEFRAQLAAYINQLINNNFEKLISLL